VAGAAADVEDLELASISAKEVAVTFVCPRPFVRSARAVVIANSVCRSTGSITERAAIIMNPTITMGMVD